MITSGHGGDVQGRTAPATAEGDLRRLTRDLVALSALPAALGTHDEPAELARRLASALLSILRCEIVAIEVRGEGGVPIARVACLSRGGGAEARWREFGEELLRRTKASTSLSPFEELHPEGEAGLRAVGRPLGHSGQEGLIVAAGRAEVFPSEADLVLLGVGASQAAIALENARLHREARREIRERQRAEEELRRSEERSRLLIERVTEYAILFLGPDGIVTTWNPGVERLEGYAPAEIIGKSFTLFYPPEDRSAGKPEALLREAALHGIARDEGWRVRKDGSRFWADVTITALRDGGSLVGFAEIMRDLSERRRSEEDIRKLNVDLTRTVEERTRELRETIRELDGFGYTVAHDLRAPLRAMQGYAEIVLEDAADRLEAGERTNLRRIKEAADRMDALVRGLLAYGRLSRTEMRCEPIDLAAVVTEVLAGMSRELGDKKAEVVVEGGIPNVLGHRLTLVQVIANLLSNAVKFVAAGVAPRIRIAAQTRPGWVRLIVEDNGIGLPQEQRERIFGVFERLHLTADYPGTGVGLAIVKRGVERMGGRVGVETHEGRGSSFWFELPEGAASPLGREEAGLGRPGAAPEGA